MQFCRIAFVSILGAFGLLAGQSLAAALEIEPGQWEATQTSDLDGKPGQPELSTECVTPQDARDPVKALTGMQENAGGKCKVAEVKQTGNVVSFTMNCTEDSVDSIRMTASFTFENARHYTGRLQTTMSAGGQTMTSNMTVDAKWIGACKAK